MSQRKPFFFFLLPGLITNCSAMTIFIVEDDGEDAQVENDLGIL